MKTTAKIITVTAADPEAFAIERAADVISAGGVVILPTMGLYGLGAHALNDEAVQRLFRLKGRDRSKPILVLVASGEMVEQMAEPLSAPALSMMAHFWPGRVTFVVSARDGLPPGLSAGSGKIGVRMAAHPVARALVQVVGAPLTGTSANLAGAGGCAAVDDIDPAVIDCVDLVLDSGRLTGVFSTVVDLTGGKPVILREGAVPAHEIMTVFSRMVDGG